MLSFKKSLAALIGLTFLVVAVAIVLPLVGRAQTGGNPFNRDTRRSFYVTRTTHDGSQALTACANGYHMASMWEIVDFGNLQYNADLGGTAQDSGFAPPAGGPSEGWIRPVAVLVTPKLLASVTAMLGPARAQPIGGRLLSWIRSLMSPVRGSAHGLVLQLLATLPPCLVCAGLKDVLRASSQSTQHQGTQFHCSP